MSFHYLQLVFHQLHQPIYIQVLLIIYFIVFYVVLVLFVIFKRSLYVVATFFFSSFFYFFGVLRKIYYFIANFWNILFFISSCIASAVFILQFISQITIKLLYAFDLQIARSNFYCLIFLLFNLGFCNLSLYQKNFFWES